MNAFVEGLAIVLGAWFLAGGAVALLLMCAMQEARASWVVSAGVSVLLGFSLLRWAL